MRERETERRDKEKKQSRERKMENFPWRRIKTEKREEKKRFFPSFLLREKSPKEKTIKNTIPNCL
jgi:hypothetical protein